MLTNDEIYTVSQDAIERVIIRLGLVDADWAGQIANPFDAEIEKKTFTNYCAEFFDNAQKTEEAYGLTGVVAGEKRGLSIAGNVATGLVALVASDMDQEEGSSWDKYEDVLDRLEQAIRSWTILANVAAAYEE